LYLRNRFNTSPNLRDDFNHIPFYNKFGIPFTRSIDNNNIYKERFYLILYLVRKMIFIYTHYTHSHKRCVICTLPSVHQDTLSVRPMHVSHIYTPRWCTRIISPTHNGWVPNSHMYVSHTHWECAYTMCTK
jgi:hypothetical protein